MKIAVCSDLHLEFGDLDLHNDEGADVLILGGDILVAEDLKGAGSPIVKEIMNTITVILPKVINLLKEHLVI